MAKQNWKPGNMLYPAPCGHGELSEFHSARFSVRKTGIRWKTEYYYHRVGWHSLHQSADGFDLRPPGALLIPPD